MISDLSADYGLDLDDDVNNQNALAHYDHLFTQYFNTVIKKDEKYLLNVSTRADTGFNLISKEHRWHTLTIPFQDILQVSTDFENRDETMFEDFKGKFDLIVFNHVFEHFLKPVNVLRLVSSWLQSRGCIFIVSPNIDSDDFKSKGHRWNYIKIPYHINYFNAISIDRIFEKVASYGMLFEKVFQTSFPPAGQREGESISSLYRRV